MKSTAPKLSPATPFRKAFGYCLKKRLPALLAILGLAVCGANIAHAQLVNGNLNLASVSSQVLATPTGWTVMATRSISGTFNDGASSEGFANANVPDPGGAFGLFYKPFSGNSTDGNVTVNFFQDTPATVGVTYRLSGYAGAGAGYVGLIPTNTTTMSLFAVEFLNAGNSVIGGSTLDLKTAGLGTTNGNAFGYAQYSVMATAPAGTVSVRSRASMVNAFGNPLGGDQAFVVDAFQLAAIPEPTTFLLVGLGLAGLVAVRRRS